MSKVSIILTTHGEGKYLKQAIGSVLAQTFEDWQLLVVHDDPNICTRDGAWLAPMEQNDDDRIHDWHFRVSEGVVNRYAHTINRVFKYTKGEYITYLCHDDLYLPWRLEGMVRALDHNPDVMVVYGKEVFMTSSNGDRKYNTEFLTTHGITRSPASRINHNSVMHRRECFEKVGGWDEQSDGRFGDAAFFTRLAQHWDFYPIDQWQQTPMIQFGEVMRVGEQNCWTGK